MTIAEALADFIVRQPTSDILSRMRVYALDTLTVALAGTVSASSKAATRAVLSACGKPIATVLGVGRITSPWDAALINGTSAHALELDDDHRIAVLHPGAVVVPAAFAACEAASASGQTFLKSVLVGYEVMCRVGEVFRGSQFYHGVHPTALCGVFGAAAAASAAMALDRNATVRALGIAGTQASGLTEWRADGSWIKRLHPGRAAHTGVLSAKLAAEGFTGPATIFEGSGGFFNAFSYGEKFHPECMTQDLGTEYKALGTALKPYPCCRFEHGAIDLALEARTKVGNVSQIDAVVVKIYRTDVLTYHSVPKNAVDAQFNVPYAVAVALHEGTVGLSDFTETAIRRPEVLELAKRVRVVEDSEFSAQYPDKYFTELGVTVKSGTSHFLSDCPSGDPEAQRYRADPNLFDREAEARSESLLAECGFPTTARPLADAVSQLLQAPNLDRLSAVLSARGM